MHRIDTPTAQVDKFGSGKNGFTRGNPQTGVPATAFDDDYFDAVQEELAGIVEAAGINLNKTNRAQVLAALKKLFLQSGNNLYEIKDAGPAAVAQTLANLGISGNLIPVGVPLPWPAATPPDGWLKCNGSVFDKNQLPQLALVYPSGRLPDLRGEFIRGWDDGRGVDSGRVVLTGQSQSVQQHTHDLAMAYSSESGYKDRLGAGPNSDMIPIKDMINVTTFTGSGEYYLKANDSTGVETRPRNVAFNYIVRAV